jgi:predicted nuclease of predicted toxin-antitoxin system
VLLDEMLPGDIADELRSKGHDVLAVAADPALLALPDDQILAHATATGRALVTANINDLWTARQRPPGPARVAQASAPPSG